MENEIELTEDIKKIILERCRYVIPEGQIKLNDNERSREERNGNVIFNNYGVLNNQVVQMETTEKLNSALSYNGQTQHDYELLLETCFGPNVKRLEDRTMRAAYVMDRLNLLECFNKATSASGDVTKFSFLYEKKIDKIKIFRDGQWEQYLPDMGLLILIKLMKSYFFNDYEIYLIRNLHDPTSMVRNRFLLKEHLEIYYQFLGCFDEKPHIGNMSDSEVLGFQPKEGREDWLDETYSKSYQDIYSKIRSTEKNNLRSRLLKIIVSNTNQNILDLNNIIMDILKMDEEYRTKLAQNFKLVCTGKSK